MRNDDALDVPFSTTKIPKLQYYFRQRREVLFNYQNLVALVTEVYNPEWGIWGFATKNTFILVGGMTQYIMAATSYFLVRI